MNLRQIQDIAGHRNVPPWVIKLVQDCIEHDRMHENQDLTLAYMTGFEKGKDYIKEKAVKVCEEALQTTKDAKAMLKADEIIEKSVAAGAIYQAEKLAAAIRSMK